MRVDWLWALAPRANETYRRAFDDAEAVFRRFDITTPRRMRHFWAQILHESGGLTLLSENLYYSPERLMKVWPTRFRTLQDAIPYARNPEALANKVYAGRMGNTDPGDGWKFRGRGLLQITGRHNYTTASHVLGVDFTEQPGLVLATDHCLSVAAAMWQYLGANEAADKNDLLAVTARINGGSIGAADRAAWLHRVDGGMASV